MAHAIDPKYLDIRAYRMLVGDWFRKLSEDAGIALGQYGQNDQALTFGSPTGLNVTATFVDQCPFLVFHSSDPSRSEEVAQIAQLAADRVASGDAGEIIWHSTVLSVPGFDLGLAAGMGAFLEQLGNQARILGWRRLGGNVLLEFTETLPPEQNGGPVLLAPKALVHVHVAIPAPCPGYFSAHVASSATEIAAATCTFALGRYAQLPMGVFPTESEMVPALSARIADPSVLTLARKSVGLDIFSGVTGPGGLDHFSRLRAALLTFDAAIQQRHDSVACLLYVVVAECLATPDTVWNNVKVTKRFVEFYDELMPSALDQLVAHQNLESILGIRRGARTARALRRELLTRIYAYRSGHVHGGLRPSYRSLGSMMGAEDVRRGFFAEFAEGAILNYLTSPRCSFVGHPAYCEQARVGGSSCQTKGS